MARLLRKAFLQRIRLQRWVGLILLIDGVDKDQETFLMPDAVVSIARPACLVRSFKVALFEKNHDSCVFLQSFSVLRVGEKDRLEDVLNVPTHELVNISSMSTSRALHQLEQIPVRTQPANPPTLCRLIFISAWT